MCSAVSVLLVDTQVPTLLVQEVLGKDHAHCLFLYGTPLLKPPGREVRVFIQKVVFLAPNAAIRMMNVDNSPAMPITARMMVSRFGTVYIRIH